MSKQFSVASLGKEGGEWLRSVCKTSCYVYCFEYGLCYNDINNTVWEGRKKRRWFNKYVTTRGWRTVNKWDRWHHWVLPTSPAWIWQFEQQQRHTQRNVPEYSDRWHHWVLKHHLCLDMTPLGVAHITCLDSGYATVCLRPLNAMLIQYRWHRYITLDIIVTGHSLITFRVIVFSSRWHH